VAEEDVWSQREFAVRFGWGPLAAARMADPDGVLVVVDVLSFTTAVDVAVSRGTAVYPCEWHGSRATKLARSVGAELAVGRGQMSPERPWSLSPASLLAAPAPERLVLPSPNGSTIASAATGTVVTACLRNAAAVASWLTAASPAVITVISAGERWPDDSLRPALEDLLGAAAVLSGLADRTGTSGWSPDAIVAARSFDPASVADAVRSCGSAKELHERGYSADVDVAIDVDASSVVPVLRDGAFVA
jgi:2-phosphosulfolactate phosphatase